MFDEIKIIKHPLAMDIQKHYNKNGYLDSYDLDYIRQRITKNNEWYSNYKLFILSDVFDNQMREIRKWKKKFNRYIYISQKKYVRKNLHGKYLRNLNLNKDHTMVYMSTRYVVALPEMLTSEFIDFVKSLDKQNSSTKSNVIIIKNDFNDQRKVSVHFQEYIKNNIGLDNNDSLMVFDCLEVDQKKPNIKFATISNFYYFIKTNNVDIAAYLKLNYG